MEIKRFIIETDENKSNELSRTDLDNISEEEKKRLMKSAVEQALARAGYRKRVV